MFQSLRKRSSTSADPTTTTAAAASSYPPNIMTMDRQNENQHISTSPSTNLTEATALLPPSTSNSNTNSRGNNQQQQNSTNNNNNNNNASASVLNPITGIPAGFYVLSGCSQPLIMTLCKNAGLANSNCQLYMLFYYLGPACVGILQFLGAQQEGMPHWTMVARAGGITVFDIAAQAMNYTGAALAGPTIFSIVYASVTVWTAIFSRLVLHRTLVVKQWIGIWIVFLGMTITATDHSVQIGSDVAHGLVLVVVGSAMHGFTYVLCEIVMIHVSDDTIKRMPGLLKRVLVGGTSTASKKVERLTVIQNCSIQGCFAVLFMLSWQCIYTIPNFSTLIQQPALRAGTTIQKAVGIFTLFAMANFIHSLSYFFTLRHFPGGATSAGVMKGLQAVLVFIVTDYFFCNHQQQHDKEEEEIVLSKGNGDSNNSSSNGSEMCFSNTKFISLCTVVGGVVIFGYYTEKQQQQAKAVLPSSDDLLLHEEESSSTTTPATNMTTAYGNQKQQQQQQQSRIANV